MAAAGKKGPLLALATNADGCALLVVDLSGQVVFQRQFAWGEAAKWLRRVTTSHQVQTVLIARTFRHRWLLAVVWTLLPDIPAILIRPQLPRLTRDPVTIGLWMVSSYLRSGRRED